MNIPKILAPAGDTHSFLAAIAAGADAIYCGLKIFSARMEATNFSVEELARLTQLARSHDIDVFLTVNSIIKESELEKTFKILCKLIHYVDLQGLIIQDPGLLWLARKAGFDREFHLSTLGNCTSASGILAAAQTGFNTIVLPREFTIDEIKAVAESTPDQVSLEVFVHGALCYSVSGRCYWSSWFGGKSSLRGRCVQPCRRMYEQKGQKKRHFSCMDFSADILVKVLKEIPQITAWKIEGRKKSPHYVYYTVKAYKLLRDEPARKKEALTYLDYAMGRDFSHYNLLSQRVMNPLDHQSETGSGLFVGRIKNPAEPFFITREALMVSDLLRVGYEGDGFHDIQRVTRSIPKKGKFYLNKKARHKIQKGTPVFLIDRREALLADDIKSLEDQLKAIAKISVKPIQKPYVPFPRSNKIKPVLTLSGKKRKKETFLDMNLFRNKNRNTHQTSLTGIWISGQRYSIPVSRHDWLWIDPLLFPEDEKQCLEYIDRAVKKGAKNFVLNAPWQIALFKKPEQLNLWAGPFCNVTNSGTIHALKNMGFSGVIVSPEIDKDTFYSLPGASCLPLGVVIKGNWPLGISRIISQDLKIGEPFTSPKGETAWMSKFNTNYYIFPNWLLDLTEKKDELLQAGYSLFVHIHETIPRSVSMKKRPGLWNWNIQLL